MRALVVYESMYGNTHLIADAIGRGMGEDNDVSVIPVEQAEQSLLAGADLVVVGGPTHGHSMSRESTRQAAVADAAKPDKDLTLDPDAEGPGLRDWFDGLDKVDGIAGAAFDTRFDMPAALTGRASKGINKRLHRHGFTEVADPQSFFVEKGNTLEEGEDLRAQAWGRKLALAVAARATSTT